MWIIDSYKKSKKVRDDFSINGISVLVKDKLPEEIDPEFVFSYIGSRIPFYLTKWVEVIYVGKFPEMEQRQIKAFYENEAIYLTNEQDDDMEMIEDIIHEISHSIEHNNMDFIYASGTLEKEFLAKRLALANLLKQNYNVPQEFLINGEYDQSIDDFLFKEVGYDVLNQLCVGIFPSGYAATSVSEYWAKGFEELFLGNRRDLKEYCPVLFSRLTKLIKEMEGK